MSLFRRPRSVLSPGDMTVYSWLGLAFLAVSLFSLFRAAQLTKAMVLHLYERDRQLWQRLGSPRGFVWDPEPGPATPGEIVHRTLASRGVMGNPWETPPEWIAGDEISRSLWQAWRRWRMLQLGFFVLFFSTYAILKWGR